ncbi:hypothetical protein GQ44DRAFT_177841 [Phaeosphaeriaceae sp. PMI808]|nr:hypothetical protein GQ44DRAFT_177841 [Phaeosphaeriaceae sp. PMI808]
MQLAPRTSLTDRKSKRQAACIIIFPLLFLTRGVCSPPSRPIIIEYITTSRNCVSFVRCARWMNGSNREVLLAVMAIMGHSLLEASAAMVDRNRAGQLSLVESSYSGTYWPRPLEW